MGQGACDLSGLVAKVPNWIKSGFFETWNALLSNDQTHAGNEKNGCFATSLTPISFVQSYEQFCAECPPAAGGGPGVRKWDFFKEEKSAAA